MGLIAFFKSLFGGGATAAGRSAGDRTLQCADCGRDFIFEAGEQAFFAERGLSEPKRCPDCRKRARGRFRGRSRRRGGGR